MTTEKKERARRKFLLASERAESSKKTKETIAAVAEAGGVAAAGYGMAHVFPEPTTTAKVSIAVGASTKLLGNHIGNAAANTKDAYQLAQENPKEAKRGFWKGLSEAWNEKI